MNSKTKSTAVLAATLLIGIAIGSMGYRAYVQYHFKKMSRMVHRGGMHEMIEKRIAPTQQQKDEVELILGKYDSLLVWNNREMREKTHNLLDSMWLELTPVLGAEKVKKLMNEKPPERRPDKPHMFSGKKPRPQPLSPKKIILSIKEKISVTAQQKDTVESIIDEYMNRLGNNDILMPHEMHTLLDSMISELEHILSDAQIQHLRKSLRPPPPPPSPPPPHYNGGDYGFPPIPHGK
jgi:hypothetical protein